MPPDSPYGLESADFLRGPVYHRPAGRSRVFDGLIRTRREFIDHFGYRLLLLVALHALASIRFGIAWSAINHPASHESPASGHLFTILICISSLVFMSCAGNAASRFKMPFVVLCLTSLIITVSSLAITTLLK